MRTQCAWCKKKGPDKAPYEDTTTSHGLCDDCAKRILREEIMKRNAGVLSSVWSGAKSGYHGFRASRYEDKAKKHRAMAARYPRRRMMPGMATEIRYRRTGAQPGMYYHPFKGGVKMYANGDGSVTLRGRQRIHAVDSEPGFWERYGHGRKGMRRNPRRGSSKLFGMDTTTLLLVGGALFLLYRQSSAGGLAPFWSGVAPSTTDALAAWRLGEQNPLSYTPGAIDPMAGATEVPVDWTGMPEWSQQ